MQQLVRMDFPAMIDSLSEMPNAYDLLWINENIPLLEQKLEFVNTLLHLPVNDERFNEAIKAIHFLIDKLPLMVTKLLPGDIVYRARANYEQLFFKQQEISYNIDHAEKITAGRFNRPMEPLFYGALKVANEKVDPVLQGCLETCKELNSDDSAPFLQDLT
jgi:hypothetical protein